MTSISWPRVNVTEAIRNNRLYACNGLAVPIGDCTYRLSFPPGLPAHYFPQAMINLSVLGRDIHVELERLPFNGPLSKMLGGGQPEDLPVELLETLLAELLERPLTWLAHKLGGLYQN